MSAVGAKAENIYWRGVFAFLTQSGQSDQCVESKGARRIGAVSLLIQPLGIAVFDYGFNLLHRFRQSAVSNHRFSERGQDGPVRPLIWFP